MTFGPGGKVCFQCGNPVGLFGGRCPCCYETRYCSRQCQMLAWPNHQRDCRGGSLVISRTQRLQRNESDMQINTRTQLAAEQLLGDLGRDLSPQDMDFARANPCNRSQWWKLQIKLDTVLNIMRFYSTGPGRLPPNAFARAEKCSNNFIKELGCKAIITRRLICAQLYAMERDISTANPLCPAAAARAREQEGQMRAQIAEQAMQDRFAGARFGPDDEL
mmetsp:Transcript_55589/g.113622  ORF Transcript_55589/g.113622 Transcript_55589/m.113622 type:complete len:219 (+) Transcript_55589:1-657(+)